MKLLTRQRCGVLCIWCTSSFYSDTSIHTEVIGRYCIDKVAMLKKRGTSSEILNCD